MDRIVAELTSMTRAELEGVRRICASLSATLDMLLEAADDRAQAQPAESVAG